MRFSTIAIAAAATVANAQSSTSSAAAGRPTGTPICDYYTTALLKNNTAENQATLLTLLVNTVVIGNYTMPNVGVKVPGILAKGDVNGTAVDLAPYFSGGLASTNRGDKATCVNFLDGGAAEPLMKNKPANDMTSNQYFLLTHLYQFFGTLLGCSMQGMSGFDAYGGNPSMYKVHKFMNLGNAEMTYFITQVGMAAASFGVATDDINIVAKALGDAFNMRCAAPVEIVKGQGPQPQAICIKSDCAEAASPQCSAYAEAVAPAKCNGTSSTGGSSTATSTGGSGSGSATSSGGASATATKPPGSNAGSINSFGVGAVLAAAAAFAL